MNNNEIFLEYYKQLEDVLDQRFPDRNTSTSPVFLYERLIHGEKGRRVAILRETRNFLTHTPKFLQEDVVEVGTEVITYLKELILELSKPITVIEKCTMFEDLLHADIHTNIQGLMNQMVAKGYSHVPVLNKSKHIIGVFSESVIFSHYAKENEKDVPKIINEILDLAIIENHRSETYGFIHKNALIDEARKLFEEPKKEKRLVLLFVTETGKIEEKILGVLSPWDVM